MRYSGPEALHQAESTLLNREEWDRTVDFQLAMAENTGDMPLTVVFMDINFFKRINDNISHIAGDQVIEDVSGLLLDVAGELRTRNTEDRRADLVSIQPFDSESGRWGGDEFSVLAHTGAAGADILMKRVRDRFEDYLDQPANEQLRQLGIGIAMGAAVHETGKDRTQLVEEASAAMKEDKKRQLPPLSPTEQEIRDIIVERLRGVHSPEGILQSALEQIINPNR